MTQAFKNPNLMKVIEKFGIPVVRRTSICMEFEAFLRQINAKGKCCLEIGTYHGISTMILAQFFEQVITISVEDPNTNLTMKQQVWDYVGLKNIKAVECVNNLEKNKIIEMLDFDFCYIDGDHENDTERDFALVKHCGRVLFHEYWPLQPSVWNLVNSLPCEQVTVAKYDCFAFWQRT